MDGVKPHELLDATGAVQTKKLKALYQRAMDIALGAESFDIHTRTHVFGASSSICHKETLLSALLPSMKAPKSKKSMRTLNLGTEWHEKSDSGIDNAIWGFQGEVVRISPFELVCFPDITKKLKGYRHEGIIGTPDHLLYLPASKVLFLVDAKSANDYSYQKTKPSDPSPHYSIQVGTYLDGLLRSPIRHLVEKIAVYVVMLKKTDGEVKLIKVEPIHLQMAAQYWMRVAELHAQFTQDKRLPGEWTPITSWACQYCGFFNNWDECSKVTSITEAMEVLG